MKHFCLLELAHDSESPMIGTICNVDNTLEGHVRFLARAIEAIEEHFDSEITQGIAALIGNLELMFTGSPYEDIEINTKGDGEDDYLHKIRILETWIY